MEVGRRHAGEAVAQRLWHRSWSGRRPRMAAYITVTAHAVGKRRAEAEAAGEAERWIMHHPGREYSRPGNVRGLEQRLRNATSWCAANIGRGGRWVARAGQHVRAIPIGQETARRLGLDRRTIKAKVKADLGRGPKRRGSRAKP